MDASEFKALRLSLGLTQEELAKKLEMTRLQIINYEQGKHSINSVAADKLRSMVKDNILPCKESLPLEQIALEILKSMQPAKTPTEAVSHYKTILELLQR